MKKQYITPNTHSVVINIGECILAGSTGDISKLGISDTEEITDADQFGSRQGSFWDDEEE